MTNTKGVASALRMLTGAVAVAMAGLAGGCADDNIGAGEPDPAPSGGRYLVLKITVPRDNATAASTRANPMGGEDGNGREEGRGNENTIHNFNIFFYEAADGMNGAAATPVYGKYVDVTGAPGNNPHHTGTDEAYEVTRSSYEEKDEYTVTISYDKDTFQPQGNSLKFVTVANADNLTDITTLGDLREKIVSKTWTSSAGNYDSPTNCDYFVMSTAYNVANNHTAVMTLTPDNPDGNGVIGTGYTLIERLCARMDLWYNQTDNEYTEDGATYLKYSIDKENSATGKATVYVTNIIPVNVMSNPSFLIKQVTKENVLLSQLTTDAERKANIYYGAAETPDPNGPGNDKPTNYVVEPQTVAKNGTVNDETLDETLKKTLKTWYGSTAAFVIRESGSDAFTADNAVGKMAAYDQGPEGNDPTSATNSIYNCNRIRVIGYANENVQDEKQFNSRFITGLAFRTIFVPTTLITGYTPMTGDMTEVMAKETLAATEEDRRKYISTDDANGKKNGLTFYRYSPTRQDMTGKETGKNDRKDLYFSTKTVAENYAAAHRADNAIITEYKDGVCYYNLWLRHYNNNDDTNVNVGDKNTSAVALPMEYAIVRNNIYRVAIGFEVIGDPKPEIREDTHIHPRIFVRKWNFRKESAPIIF